MARKKSITDDVVSMDKPTVLRGDGQGNKLVLTLSSLNVFDPLTENQKKFFEAYKIGEYCVALLGSPGTGKTFGALYKILEEVLEKSTPYSQVVIVRSAVQVRDQGFLPGSLEEKMEVYEAPYIDICKTLFGRTDAYSRLKEQKVVEFISTTAIRGRTFDNCIILVDECQSMTFHEISSVMTRVGHESKIFFCGDKYQNDLIKKKGDESGFDEFFGILETMEEFLAIYFTPDDIVRSGLVKSYIKACAAKNVIPGS